MNEPIARERMDIELPDQLAALRAQTPARIFVGRAGPSYRTATWLSLRHDHAAALDAVYTELEITQHLGAGLIERYGLFEVSTQARSKEEYLMRPDLGRRLNPEARTRIVENCPSGADLQIIVGDGLSATAVAAQVPPLLPRLMEQAATLGWRSGQPFVIRHCRVGILNEVGELLAPMVAVLLIGERPGLLTAESLSAYLAYRPRAGHTDAQRNLISNIHARGVTVESACQRVLALAEKMGQAKTSGVAVKESGR